MPTTFALMVHRAMHIASYRERWRAKFAEVASANPNQAAAVRMIGADLDAELAALPLDDDVCGDLGGKAIRLAALRLAAIDPEMTMQ